MDVFSRHIILQYPEANAIQNFSIIGWITILFSRRNISQQNFIDWIFVVQVVNSQFSRKIKYSKTVHNYPRLTWRTLLKNLGMMTYILSLPVYLLSALYRSLLINKNSIYLNIVYKVTSSWTSTATPNMFVCVFCSLCHHEWNMEQIYPKRQTGSRY